MLVGFEFVSQKGSHRKFRGPTGRIVIVPMHKEIAIGTLKSILRQAGMAPENVDKYFG